MRPSGSEPQAQVKGKGEILKETSFFLAVSGRGKDVGWVSGVSAQAEELLCFQAILPIEKGIFFLICRLLGCCVGWMKWLGIV